MLKKQIMASAFAIIFLHTAEIYAQKTLVSLGGSASNSSGSISYSVGQIDFASASVSNKGSISLGVQQPLMVSPITGIKGTENLSIDCSLYPNPSADFVVLNWNDSEAKTLNYKITDISGKTILAQTTAENQSQIDVKTLTIGTYIISVADSKNNFLKSFKLIKN